MSPMSFIHVSHENWGKIGLVRDMDYKKYLGHELLSESKYNY